MPHRDTFFVVFIKFAELASISAVKILVDSLKEFQSYGGFKVEESSFPQILIAPQQQNYTSYPNTYLSCKNEPGICCGSVALRLSAHRSVGHKPVLCQKRLNLANKA